MLLNDFRIPAMMSILTWIPIAPALFTNHWKPLRSTTAPNTKRNALLLSNCRKLVFFDWDDTLFPTNSMLHLQEKVSIQQFNQYGRALHDLLVQYIRCFGAENIYVITNGEYKWIEGSIKMMKKITMRYAQNGEDNIYEAIHRILFEQIGSSHLVSARDLYSDQYPTSSWWKYFAFRTIVYREIVAKAMTECTIISIGDSWAEFIASSWIQTTLMDKFNMKRATLHRVRLRTNPKMIDMMEQLQFLRQAVTILAKEENRGITIHHEIAQQIKDYAKSNLRTEAIGHEGRVVVQ